jgi:ubiquinone biosynthesis protein COQ9
MPPPDIKAKLLEAAKPHVVFDGWSEATFQAAMNDAGITPDAARQACPKGPVDLALAYHAAGDAKMLERMQAADLEAMRYRDRVIFALRTRLELVEDKELVRRGMTLFALPQYAGLGAQAMWQTVDAIWRALGDTSADVNWYTKRMTLSGVYGSTVLYWLGDSSEGNADTWEFLDRRIEDVMQFEKFKAQMRENKLISGLMAGPLSFLGRIKAPEDGQQTGMPGRWNGPK